MTNNSGYDYVFELVNQLTPEEQDILAQELEKRRRPQWSREDIEKNRAKARKLALECPVPTEEETALQAKIREVRANLPEEKQNLSKEKYAEMLLDCPVMTDEEFEEFENARKDLRNDFNRRFGFVGPD